MARVRKHKWAVLWLAAGILVPLTLYAATVSDRTRDSASKVPLPGPATGIDCPTVTRDEAVRNADFAVYLPNHELANDANVRAFHWCTPDEVYMYYENGLRVTSAFDQIANPQKALPKIAEDIGGRIGKIQGHMAVINGDEGLEFVVDNVLVAVTGNGVATEQDLMEIGESLHPAEEPGPSPTAGSN